MRCHKLHGQLYKNNDLFLLDDWYDSLVLIASVLSQNVVIGKRSLASVCEQRKKLEGGVWQTGFRN